MEPEEKAFASLERLLGKHKPEYYAKGKRSIVYICRFKGKKCIAKVQSKASQAVNRIENEAKWLKVLNRKGIGPKLYSAGTGYMVCEFIKGKIILEWLSSAEKKDTKKILLDVLSQCREMDNMHITKEEMHKPVKHIIISKGKPRMIDFERCRKTEKPQNVTQFCQFLMSGRVYLLLKKKGILFEKEIIIQLLKEYRKDKMVFSVLLKALCLC
ncbi:MAG: hypothetical protein KJ955_04720 [Nanoarchaeota archaeon]|nr:hypothetical protein [Nanoarchaeota archaeon]